MPVWTYSGRRSSGSEARTHPAVMQDCLIERCRVRKKRRTDDFGVLLDKPAKIEHYEKRFGIAAIEKGMITATDLVKALTVQVEEDIRAVPHRLLGEIFFEMGLMTDSQVEEVLSLIMRNGKQL
jgi:hypothetical protein